MKAQVMASGVATWFAAARSPAATAATRQRDAISSDVILWSWHPSMERVCFVVVGPGPEGDVVCDAAVVAGWVVTVIVVDG
ncbi:MAG: hypothetical protein U0U69_14935 [Acidimicrobiia bacterium]